MIFHEIYGNYYNAVAAILSEAVKGELTEKRMNEIVSEKAFAESFLTVIPALKSGKWQLLNSDLTTPLKNKPSMPLTLLQKRWLKAISLDPRIKLFDVDFSFLGDVEPLFTPDDFVVFDKYNNGDPFEDKNYIKNFRLFLHAIKHKERLKIRYHGNKGHFLLMEGDPYKLEYSEKDDKFRVLLRHCSKGTFINLAGVERCTFIGNAYADDANDALDGETFFVLELTDERNSLERVMLHFAHFKKEAERLSDNKYRVKIYYDSSDETELVIRVLSFGPMVEVTEPQSFRNLIVERLVSQKTMQF
ncbi:MAG: WYL domain-containing protein [Acutalibacteraceae bacterium]